MGSFVSVRGWIEFDPENIDSVRNKIEKTPIASALSPPKTIASAYVGCWTVPERTVNWTAFAFFGCDIRLEYLDWMYEQIAVVAAAAPDSEGLFKISFHDDSETRWWNVDDGELVVGGPTEDWFDEAGR